MPGDIPAGAAEARRSASPIQRREGQIASQAAPLLRRHPPTVSCVEPFFEESLNESPCGGEPSQYVAARLGSRGDASSKHVDDLNLTAEGADHYSCALTRDSTQETVLGQHNSSKVGLHEQQQLSASPASPLSAGALESTSLPNTFTSQGAEPLSTVGLYCTGGASCGQTAQSCATPTAATVAAFARSMTWTLELRPHSPATSPCLAAAAGADSGSPQQPTGQVAAAVAAHHPEAALLGGGTESFRYPFVADADLGLSNDATSTSTGKITVSCCSRGESGTSAISSASDCWAIRGCLERSAGGVAAPEMELGAATDAAMGSTRTSTRRGLYEGTVRGGGVRNMWRRCEPAAAPVGPDLAAFGGLNCEPASLLRLLSLGVR